MAKTQGGFQINYTIRIIYDSTIASHVNALGNFTMTGHFDVRAELITGNLVNARNSIIYFHLCW